MASVREWYGKKIVAFFRVLKYDFGDDDYS